MSNDRLITLAIHSYERALTLKAILEDEGIKVVLNNVNIALPTTSSGVRVRINERDLPLALRIVENQDIFSEENIDSNPLLLVPIDFSDYSYRACLTAFHIAKLLKCKVQLLHSFIEDSTIDKIQFNNDDLEIANEENLLEISAKEQIAYFSDKIKEQIKLGNIPPIKFSTKLVEGVPEDSIIEYSKGVKPQLIVMGTRGTSKKNQELIGSVTAEVLDGCRFPVFTVPESINEFNIKNVKHVVFFSNIEHEDIIALDLFYRLFPNLSFEVTIIHIPQRTMRKVDSHITSSDDLLSYCQNNYPRYNFIIKTLSINDVATLISDIGKSVQTDLIVVPNKKKNVFARFFNPSLAHKMLFHADIPMMTLPV